jgi:hypothetical protein
MDEARRFLRYVTPGLSFAVQALLLFFIVSPVWTLGKLNGLKEDAGAGLAFALFLGSGGLGYIFSVIHHSFHWWWKRKWLSAIDHTRVVKRLCDEHQHLLELRRLDGLEVEIDKIDRKGAWVVLTALWKQALANNSPIQSADKCATGLTDVMHSAGAARVGAICALVALGVWVGLDFFFAWRLWPLKHVLPSRRHSTPSWRASCHYSSS